MAEMTATEVTNIARREPPRVQRHGRTAVVVVDAAQHDRLVLRAEANSTPLIEVAIAQHRAPPSAVRAQVAPFDPSTG